MTVAEVVLNKMLFYASGAKQKIKMKTRNTVDLHNIQKSVLLKTRGS